MNRDTIRNIAAGLGIRTAKFAYAETRMELLSAANDIGYPVVVKPVMSSSGKGQSVVQSGEAILAAWDYAIDNSRGDRQKVIVEEFINFHTEITILTIKQQAGDTIFCNPIGHVQERGDYQYSWQNGMSLDHVINYPQLDEAERICKLITDELGGAGVFGVEFFITNKEVIFSELSPRPHDTGMVTLISQNLSEFDLHARAILGLPIPMIIYNYGASAVVLGNDWGKVKRYEGVDQALLLADDVRIFGKEDSRPYRRMAVVLGRDLQATRDAAHLIKIVVQ
jgi:phosphoribosylglycinamide formyltransferase 2